MFCFIWPDELSFLESAWSSLNLAQISSRFSWAIRDPRFSRVLLAWEGGRDICWYSSHLQTTLLLQPLLTKRNDMVAMQCTARLHTLRLKSTKWFNCCTLRFCCGKRQAGEDTQACDWSLEPTQPWIVNIPQMIILIGFLSYHSYQPLLVTSPAAAGN